ncbi:MFS domain-containing protein [Fusarium phalaenopsidis]
MVYCCLSYFFNFLDRAAFANAYVAGLREDLNMTGGDYSNVLAVTTAGMAIGQLPYGIVIQKVAPRIWFPSMVAIWAGAAAKTVTQLCVIRFFLGLAEASTYAGAIYIISSWYKPDESSKRTALFTASGQVGTMFAGVMMAAIHKGMNGMSGLQGWQWVFLIDGIITLPIAVFGFLYFPDTPGRTQAKYLSANEKKLTQINTYPLGVQAVGIVANMLAAWHMDATGQRIPAAIVAILLQVVVGSMLLVRDIPFAGTFFAFYLSGTAYAVNPLIFGWAGLILQRSGDDAVRSVTLYSMNIGSMVLWTFWGILFYSGADTPYWKKGCIVLLVCCFVMFCYMWLVYKVDKHTAKKYRDRMPGAIDPEAKLAEPVELAEQEMPTVTGKDDNITGQMTVNSQQ